MISDYHQTIPSSSMHCTSNTVLRQQRSCWRRQEDADSGPRCSKPGNVTNVTYRAHHTVLEVSRAGKGYCTGTKHEGSR